MCLFRQTQLWKHNLCTNQLNMKEDLWNVEIDGLWPLCLGNPDELQVYFLDPKWPQVYKQTFWSVRSPSGHWSILTIAPWSPCGLRSIQTITPSSPSDLRSIYTFDHCSLEPKWPQVYSVHCHLCTPKPIDLKLKMAIVTCVPQRPSIHTVPLCHTGKMTTCPWKSCNLDFEPQIQCNQSLDS